MKKLWCFLFGHKLKPTFEETIAQLEFDDYIKLECIRCGYVYKPKFR